MDGTLLAPLGLGLILGIKHALDPDHIVALSTIVSEQKSLARSSLVGAFWGAGHTTTLSLFGLAVILLKLTIPDRVALGMEFGVAVMLILLGSNLLLKLNRGGRLHLHTHDHDGQSHLHVHLHEGGAQVHAHSHLLQGGLKPFLVGLVHGAAGSAALMLLVLTTIPSPLAGFLYILIFGVGSMAGMLVVSSAISLPFLITARRFAEFEDRVRALAGAISVAFGLLLAWQIGFVDGLFTPLPLH